MGTLRIAFVTETWLPARNGVVTRLEATSRELQRAGHHVVVVAPAGSDRPLDGITVHGVVSVGVPFIYGGQHWGLPLPRVARLLNAFRPDVVHAVNPTLLGWAGVLYARSRGVPLVCSYHTHVARYARFYGLGFAERPVWALVTSAHALAQVNLAASEAAAAELGSRGVAGVRVWAAGIEGDRFHPRPPDAEMRHRLSQGRPGRPLALYVGRLAAEKGIERLLPLAGPGGPAQLALVGEGPARRALEARFAGTATMFAGALAGEELARAYAAADVFVFPSTTDTLGLVLLEAMASGLPVIAARTAASAELLGTAPAGALFEPDEPAGLLAAASRAIQQRPDSAALAAAARRRLLTWEQATRALLDEYRDAMEIVHRRAAA